MLLYLFLMGNVPPSATVRAKADPISQTSSDKSAHRDNGRQSRPGVNIMQVAKKHLQNLGSSRQSQSSPSYVSASSTDKQSRRSSQSGDTSASSHYNNATSAHELDFIDGRTFQINLHTKYSLPCDEIEQDRMMNLVNIRLNR